MHRHLGEHIPVSGMNRGSLGFLMNEYREDDLLERLSQAEVNTVHPQRMVAIDANGALHEALAINEVSLFRASHQAAKLRVTIRCHAAHSRTGLRWHGAGKARHRANERPGPTRGYAARYSPIRRSAETARSRCEGSCSS
jgi:hypothetical protein